VSPRATALQAQVAAAVAGRPRHVALAALVGGMLLGPWTPPAAAALAGAGAVLALAALGVRGAAPLLVGVLVAGGALGAAERARALEATALGPEIGRDVRGEVTVLAAPRTGVEGGRRVLVGFRGEPVLMRPGRWLDDVRLEVGAIVAVEGRLRAPDRAARALRAHATLRATALRPTGRRRGGLAGAVDAIRRRAERALVRPLPPPEAALARGMVLGQDEALPHELREAFRASGLAHLVAASGQNIMLLVGLALAAGAVAGIGVRARWLAAGALIALYVPLAGAGPSIQRAGIMGAATTAAAVAGRPSSRGYAFLLAAALTLALDPRAAADPGWQLSFAAVAGIALLARPIRARLADRGVPRMPAEATAVTAAATLATAPVMAARFDRVSLVSLPANVLAAPAVAPVMWLGTLAGAVGQVEPRAAAPLMALAGLPLGYLVALGRIAGGLPGAEAAVPTPVVAAALGAGAWLRRARREAVPFRGATRPRTATPGPGRRRPVRVAAVVAVAGAAVLLASGARGGQPALAPPPADALRVVALDVGQGDATLLQAGGRAVMVDAGPPEARVVAGLRAAGVRRLDALVLTHPQADHDGGAAAVLSALPVGVVLRADPPAPGVSADRVAATASARGVRVVAAGRGREVRAGPLRLRILWPPDGSPPPGADPNDRSIVAVASAHGASVLLPGDAESPVLSRLPLPAVDVLKVSHHGSADPGLPALLRRLRPRAALIEVGRANRHGHPHPSTLDALRAVPFVGRTDRDGTVAVDVRAGEVTVRRLGAAGAG